jgi:hypothetical protein
MKRDDLPVMSFPIPDLEARVERPRRKSRKKGLLRVKYAQWRIDGLRALAQSCGMTLDMVVRFGLHEIKERLESILGVGSIEARKLTSAERKRIARKVNSVHAAMPVYFRSAERN